MARTTARCRRSRPNARSRRRSIVRALSCAFSPKQRAAPNMSAVIYSRRRSTTLPIGLPRCCAHEHSKQDVVMDYVAPQTVEEAWRALEAEDARCLAGGQSLVAMMNLGLVAPSRLVSLRRIASLRGVATEDDGSLRIGAMTTHAELAALDTAECGPALLAQAARVVAYPAVRAFGTIGGSVAHADPAADYPVALVAADAVIEVGSATGTHRIAARDFFHGLFETALKPGEIVTAIVVPRGPKS